MISARHQGKIGDLIYSLPVAKALGVDALYVPEKAPEAISFYSSVARFLRCQSWIRRVDRSTDNLGYLQADPCMSFTYDLDLHRTHPFKGSRNIVHRYFDVFGLKAPNQVLDPWIELPQAVKMIPGSSYSLVCVTQRYRSRRIDWGHILKKRVNFRPVLTGRQEDVTDFMQEYHLGDVEILFAQDLLDLAHAVDRAEEVWCNQNAVLPLAQGLGKRYFVEVKPNKTNCIFNNTQETIL